MENLIKALQIFLKYDNPPYPTHCEHDELWIVGNYSVDSMSADDVAELERLGFEWTGEAFKSFEFGSA